MFFTAAPCSSGRAHRQAGLSTTARPAARISDIKTASRRGCGQARAQLDLAGKFRDREMPRLRSPDRNAAVRARAAKKRQQDFYLDLDTRVQARTQPGASAAPEAAPAQAAKPAVDGAAGQEFQGQAAGPGRAMAAESDLAPSAPTKPAMPGSPSGTAENHRSPQLHAGNQSGGPQGADNARWQSPVASRKWAACQPSALLESLVTSIIPSSQSARRNSRKWRLTLRIWRIFYSLQAGIPRWTADGVHPIDQPRCAYVVRYRAFTGGGTMTTAGIWIAIPRLPPAGVRVTGQALAQKNCRLKALCDAVTTFRWRPPVLSTSDPVDPRVSRIVDLAPALAKPGAIAGENVELLRPADEVRLSSLARRLRISLARSLAGRPRRSAIRSSSRPPRAASIPPARRLDHEDELPVRFQLQLHKMLWGNMRK